MASCSAEAAIISFDSVDTEALSVPELRLIFSRQKLFWPDGTPIRVFVLPPDSAFHKRFCTETLELLPYVLQRNWDRQVSSGTADRPQIVSTIAEMEVKVRETPGAIGYLPDEVAARDEFK
ncbi:substrate-binding domain-containing protein [Shewanella jiangmenensis]|nr:substrate-binding domain-containing protein [Shewanella jiangmenensis]